MKYKLDKTSGSARRGRLVFERPQGTFSVETPAFMPVGCVRRVLKFYWVTPSIYGFVQVKKSCVNTVIYMTLCNGIARF